MLEYRWYLLTGDLDALSGEHSGADGEEGGGRAGDDGRGRRQGWSCGLARRKSWTGRGDQIRAQLAMIEDDIIG